MTQPLRFVIDEQHFRDLVAGKEVQVIAGKIAMILSDIGFDRMIDAIADAMADATTGKSQEEVIQFLTAALRRPGKPP